MQALALWRAVKEPSLPLKLFVSHARIYQLSLCRYSSVPAANAEAPQKGPIFEPLLPDGKPTWSICGAPRL